MDKNEDAILDEQIESCNQGLKRYETGTPEHSRILADLMKLIEFKDARKRAEESRMDKEREAYMAFEREEAEKEQARKLEKERKRRESNEFGLKVFKVVGDLGLTAASLVGAYNLSHTALGLEYDMGNETSNVCKNLVRTFTKMLSIKQ